MSRKVLACLCVCLVVGSSLPRVNTQQAVNPKSPLLIQLELVAEDTGSPTKPTGGG
jgi:hypothetical protein